jgi:queuine tRNA-ribosyltransferase
MDKPISFKIEKKMEGELGRAGVLTTKHGEIKTPAFVAVGTKATVKTITPEQLKSLGSQVTLANTYHLYLEPGEELIKKAGGLGKFMNWSGPTMTDSGGFQVFSLGAAYGKSISKILHNKNIEPLLPQIDEEKDVPKIAKIDPDGVTFRDHSKGDAHYFTPEKAIQIQHDIGADMIFAFDECTAPTESKHYQMEALDRTHRWARKCLAYHLSKENSNEQALFGVVQGGREEDLRKESAQFLKDLEKEGKGFDGFGIGGSFAKEDMSTAVKWVNEILPEDKPRHLLGIGEPKDIFIGIRNGVDLFDCVAPTRIARNGQVYTFDGKINLTNAKFREDLTPIDSECDCYTCTNYTKGYIAHLIRSKEALSMTLATIHNLRFIVRLVDTCREKLIEGTFNEYEEEFLSRYE